MKILIATKDYLPHLGGVPTMARALKAGFESSGVEVKIVTQTCDKHYEDSNTVFRNLSFKENIQLYQWADIVLLNNMSVKAAFWAMLTNKPYVLSMSGWFSDGPNALFRFIFQFISSQASANISACKAVQRENYVDSTIIPNPYNDRIFTNLLIKREYSYLFAGRITECKGVIELINVWENLTKKNIFLNLTIIGDGDLYPLLKKIIFDRKLEKYIQLKPSISQEDLVFVLNQTDFFLIPSSWNEPIGIVCLEAIACGAIPIGSNGGGLGESIGPCGLTFSRLNWNELEIIIEKTVSMGEEEKERLRLFSRDHLKQFKIKLISERYLQCMKSILGL